LGFRAYGVGFRGISDMGGRPIRAGLYDNDYFGANRISE